MELAVYKEQLGVKREASIKTEEGTKSKMVYIEGCALILISLSLNIYFDPDRT